MTQWYLSYDGKQIGPLSITEAITQAKSNPHGYAWRDGFPDWVQIAKVGELSSTTVIAPPPLAGRTLTDDIEYKIHGSEMQFVEVILDAGESCVAEAGSLMYKDQAIRMETIFGDGSHRSDSGFLGKLVGAGKRLITGESLFTTVFTHTGSGKGKVAFAAPYPGNIIPVTLANLGGSLICQKDSFLCAAKGVSMGIYFQRKILTGLFGGEGFIMQRLDGDGLTFVHAGGTLVERELKAGEQLHVDTGCVVAFTPSVNFSLTQAGGIKSMLFGGEGVFLAELTGPGHVWLQSLPFSRLAGRMLSSIPKQSEEGSVLGELGRIVQGDRS